MISVLHSHPRLSVTSALILVFFVFYFATFPSSHFTNVDNLLGSVLPARRHVAIASTFEHHMDVYMAIAAAVRRCLLSDGSVRVYSPPFQKSFGDIVENLDLYHGKHHAPQQLLVDFESTDLRDRIDLLILGTCEFDLQKLSPALLEIWDARPIDEKFHVVCLVHDGGTRDWLIDPLSHWTRRGAMRLLTIADHVTHSYRRQFAQLADSTNVSIRTAGYEYVKIDTFIPVLDLSPLYPMEQPRSRPLTNAVVQGFFERSRRDYEGLFSDLIVSLQEDPSAWGYKRLLFPERVYTANPLDPSPFILHLVGGGSLDLPEALTNIVQLHIDLPYVDYYTFISSMDIMVPAWSANHYYEEKASSTVAVTLECNIPFLVTSRILSTYTFFPRESALRVTVTRPQAVREIEALKALRTGLWANKLNTTADTVSDMNRMLTEGWKILPQNFSKLKKIIWGRNKGVIQRILVEP